MFLRVARVFEKHIFAREFREEDRGRYNLPPNSVAITLNLICKLKPTLINTTLYRAVERGSEFCPDDSKKIMISMTGNITISGRGARI